MIFLVLFIISLVATFCCVKYFPKLRLVDHPVLRSSHKNSTPTGGGIAILVTCFIGSLYFYLNGNIAEKEFYALLPAFMLGLVGFLDDYVNLSVGIRLFAQVVTSVATISFLDLDFVSYGFFSVKGDLLVYIFTVPVLLYITNVYNFLDGINGYAGMETVFSFLLFAFVFPDNAEIFYVFAVSSLGFLFFNWGKAKIFMGDVGSTFLGFSLVSFALSRHNSSKSMLILFLILSLFFFDGTFTLIRRLLNGKKITEAHKEHCYQQLVVYGWSHRKVSTYGLGLNLLILCLIIFLEKNNFILLNYLFLFLVIIFSLIYFLIITKLKQMKK